MSKVLYFIALAVPTAAESAAIARLQTIFDEVQVRNGSMPAADQKYGANLESFDFLAGTAIPAAYSGAPGATTIAVPSAINPDQFKIWPATVSLDASDVDKQVLAAIKAVINPATGLAEMANLTGDASVTWSSSDATKATVNASSGLLTAVAAGSTTITATLQAAASITGVAAEADTDVFTKATHGLLTGDAVDLLNLGSGTGFGSVGDTRYIIKTGADTFKLATTYANAIAGTAVDVTGDATGASICKARVTSTCAVTVVA